MLLNVKAIFVLAEAFRLGAHFLWTALGWLGLGFLIPNAAGLGWLEAQGALLSPVTIEQVWRWGLLYTASATSLTANLTRLANWTAFSRGARHRGGVVLVERLPSGGRAFSDGR